MEAHALYIKRIINGKETLFPSDANPAVIGQYTCNYTRMGGVPTMEGSFVFPRCLDSDWTFGEYIDYNGDRFYFSQKPSSVQDNESCMFKHTFTASLHREILDNTLFFDVVSDNEEDASGGDVYRSNLTKFTFSGTLSEFVSRINHALTYCGLYDHTKKEGYRVVVDPMVDSDDTKELSFEDKYITEVLQEIHNTFGQNYYWDGKTCHVSDYQNEIKDVIRYGENDALLSISRENSNYKRIDMITGYGSSDNIPYYYPNDDEYGEAVFTTENVDASNVGVSLSKVIKKLGGRDCYNNKLTLYNVINNATIGLIPFSEGFKYKHRNIGAGPSTKKAMIYHQHYYSFFLDAESGTKVDFTDLKSTVKYNGSGLGGSEKLVADSDLRQPKILKITYRNIATDEKSNIVVENVEFGATAVYEIVSAGLYEFEILYEWGYYSKYYMGTDPSTGVRFESYATFGDFTITESGNVKVEYTPAFSGLVVRDSVNNKFYDLDSIGITMPAVEPGGYNKAEYSFKEKQVTTDGHNYDAYYIEYDESGLSDAPVTITITGKNWIMPTGTLMPSIYRKSGGKERFYYALNDTHKIPGSDNYYVFNNQYVEGNPHQGSMSHEDIKPTIRNIRNDVIQDDGLGQLFGEIADIAFDSNDNDLKDSNDTFIHQYFYIKLHKFSGEFGFNLFTHALESDNAKINMIDCMGCPACVFAIKSVWNADKTKNYNCVSTDGYGNLVSIGTEKDDYILSKDASMSDKLNQNTQEKEIWIAVQKDASTYSIVMPNSANGFKPKKGDKFVITGIKPPKVLTTSAEKALDEALIEDMYNANDDKFSYTIKFSRIFLQENPLFAERLNENSKLNIEYNGIIHSLYVSNYTKRVDENILEDVQVELVEELSASQDQMKSTIDGVKGELVGMIQGANSNGQSVGNLSDYFVSKLNDDNVLGTINFLKAIIARGGVSIGRYGIDNAGNAMLSTIKSDGIRDYNSKDSDRVATGAQGFDIFMGDDGKSYAYLDNLIVRNKAMFSSLDIRKVSYAGGSVIYSNAGSTIEKVEYVYNTDRNSVIAVKCYAKADDGTTRTMNWWRVGMMALCQTFNIGDNSNRYYWRLVIGTGTETLGDGREYYWVMLSNVETFTGNDAIIPQYGDGILARENLDILQWGDNGSVVYITQKQGMATMSSISDAEKDDAGTLVAKKTFYGYDKSLHNDLPAIGDVIVQAGDQIRWKSRGNMAVIRTSSEDENSDNVPSITMYHSLGAPYSTGKTDSDGNPISNPYQWKKRVSVESPSGWLINADRFKFFTDDDESQIVEPIATTYEISASMPTLTIHADGTTTPADYSLSMYRHYGSKTETVTSDYYLYAVAKFGANTTETYLQYGTPLWNALSPSLPSVRSLRFEAYNGAHAEGGVLVATQYIPIVKDGTDGVDGKSVSIKGSLPEKSELPKTGQEEGDGYIINGDLWTYTGTSVEDDENHNGFTNVGKIQGPSGKDATQYYIYTAWMNTPENTDGSFTTSNPGGKSYSYLGTCVSTQAVQPSTWSSYNWSMVKGSDGKDGESVRMTGKVKDAIVDGALPDGSMASSWQDVVDSGLVTSSAGDVYLFWLADGAGSKAQVITYRTSDTYSEDDANIGDSYVVSDHNSIMGVYGHLYSCADEGGYTDWRDLGMWHGLDGVSIVATPGNVVFTTDNTGVVKSMTGQTNKITLRAERGYETASIKIKGIEPHGCKATFSGSQITITSVDVEEVALSDGSKKILSVGGGYVIAECDVDGGTYYTSIGFSVNIGAYASRVEWDSKQYNSTFESYKKNTDGKIDKMESDISQNAEKISLSVTKDGLTKAGVNLSEEGITLTADKTYVKNSNGDIIAVFNADGSLVAGSLQTKNLGDGKVVIEGGLIRVFNSDDICNIQFGVSGSYSVLTYFDNDGKKLYDLGPNGLTAGGIRGVEWYNDVFIKLTNSTDYSYKFLWSDGNWHDTSAPSITGLSSRSYYRAEGNMEKAAFANPSGIPKWSENGFSGVPLYKYYAAKVNGVYVADADARLTAEEAKEADGRWFTQQKNIGGGVNGKVSLNYLAEGTFVSNSRSVQLNYSFGDLYTPTYCITGVMQIILGTEQMKVSLIVSNEVSKRSGILTV